MDDFQKVAAAEDLAEGDITSVEAHGYRIALFRDGGSFHALWSRCPHAGGPLDEGYVEEGTVACPWHGSVFRLDTGECVGGPSATDAVVFPVEVVDGEILVGPPPAGTDPPPVLLF